MVFLNVISVPQNVVKLNQDREDREMALDQDRGIHSSSLSELSSPLLS